MTDQPPVCTAFYLATEATAAKHGKPIPPGLNETTVGDWLLVCNAGKEPLDYRGNPLAPWNFYAENQVYVGFALFGPFDGMFGALPEDRFIADMKAAGFGDDLPETPSPSTTEDTQT